MVFRTDHINRKFTHKAKVTSNIPHNVTKKMGTPKTPIQKPKVETYKPKQSRAIKISHINYGPFEKVIPLGLDDEQTLTSSSPPTNLKQAVNDDRLVNKPSWTDKLFAAIPSVQFPKAYAENIDTQGNLDAENEKLIPTLDPNLAADRFVDPAGIYDPYTTVATPGGGHRDNTNRYGPNAAEASPSDSSIFTPVPEVKDEIKLDPYPKMTTGPQAGGWFENKQGTTVYAKKPEGSTLGTINDYVKNEERSSFYNLPSDVSQSQHQAALDKQSMYKFENKIQYSFSTMLRDSGPGNRINEQNFLDLKSQINNSNISPGKKDDLISEYTNKIINYQKAAGGYGTSDPWSFGTKSSSNPNKAERLQNKLDSGGQLSEKERNYLAVVTGKNKAFQYDSIGMGQVPDYAEMFTPVVTDKVLKKKEQPIWFDYHDIGY